MKLKDRAPSTVSGRVPKGPTAQRRAENIFEQNVLGLTELSQELGSSVDLYAIAELALFNLMGQLGASRAALWAIPIDESEDPVLLKCLGMAEAMGQALSVACIPQISQQFPSQFDRLYATDISNALEPSHQKLIEQSGLPLFGALFAHGRLNGIVGLGSHLSGRSYTQLQMIVLEASLNQIGVAIENAMLYSDLRENNRRITLAMEELEQLDELKEEFLSNLNHEVRTPLTIILSLLEMLKEDQATPATVGELIGEVHSQAEELRDLLIQLLEFSDLTRGKQLTVNLAKLDLVKLLEDYADDRRPGISRQLRRLVSDLYMIEAITLADEKRLRQVLDELIDNAVKFTPQGTEITLRARNVTVDHKPWARIDISDNGPGIPRDSLETVFRPFRQLDGSTTRTVGGLGVGLSMAQELVSLMGGNLQAASRLGRGTTFSILLPLSTGSALQ